MTRTTLGSSILASVHTVTALLRIALLVPLLVLAPVLHEVGDDWIGYAAAVGAFAVWGGLTLWWSRRRHVAPWAGPASIFVDLALFVAMALGSSGATSYITPVFYLYPVFTVFYYRPLLTAAVGFLVAAGYAGIWLQNFAVRGGPYISGIVWMHFLLLTWMALTTTALSLVLAHRARVENESRLAHDSLTAQLLVADVRASTRLADDLHDGPLQDVIAVRRLLEQIADTTAAPDRVAAAEELLVQVTAHLRGTVASLHPQVLSQLGLEEAVRELVRQSTDHGRVPVTAAVEAVGHLDPGRAYVLYAAGRELVRNALRHAHAEHVLVELCRDGDHVELTVSDDGIGLAAGISPGEQVRSGHVGLASHTSRLRSLGGSLELSPRQPTGTIARASLPAEMGRELADVLRPQDLQEVARP
ncbi:ATP-binding protein [Nocardioides zeae]|uniref:histidine kinase n=1 Tax=Nocardioides imazamoxiresistens TaxID=3231893 RepID=A0ABU3PVL6_9ACTN|nr:ATP-binding protein [Nocardioides zeae]MDT9593239.1 ATP-binding protein [Nocardioides zeae]